MFILSLFFWIVLAMVIAFLSISGAIKMKLIKEDDDTKIGAIAFVSLVISGIIVFSISKETYEPFELFEKFKDEVKKITDPKKMEKQVKDMKKAVEDEKNKTKEVKPLTDKEKKETEKAVKDEVERVKQAVKDTKIEVETMKKQVETEKKKKAEVNKIGKK